LLRVPYVYGLALLAANFWIVGFLQPKAQYAYQELRFELSSGALGASIKVGEFTHLGRGMTMRVERSENHGTDLYGVFLRIAIRANFHCRMVEVAMMLLVPLLAVALAVPPKRSTSGLGIFVAIIFVVVYHKVNQYAEQMGALGRFDPVIALWVPFLLFGGS